jgi:hypothetical protein
MTCLQVRGKILDLNLGLVATSTNPLLHHMIRQQANLTDITSGSHAHTVRDSPSDARPVHGFPSFPAAIIYARTTITRH